MGERDHPDKARWWEFEQFVAEILTRTLGISVSATEHDEALAGIGSRDEGFDLVSQRDGRSLLATAKSKTPQIRSRMASTTEQLRVAAKVYQQVHGGGKSQLLAVFPGALCLRQSWISSVTHEVEVWDGRYLQRQARGLGIPAPAFLALL